MDRLIVAEWKIKYWENENGSCPIQDWLDGLSKVQYKSLANKLILLEKCGNELKMPNSRSLKQGLFELRDSSFGLRIYYCFSKNQIIILVHSGEKKGQQKDIIYARKIVEQIEKERKK